ncbi:MAG TPA: PP2C family protein-serine/threonine phosphatase [Bacteroidales bacterium]|nr:PP2C family protein-serine/threonine phosphatase [Bacteroidales bacterium]
MAEKKDPKGKVESLKQTLKWLFEITDAINENKPVSDMLSTFEDILTNQLSIGKVMIFKSSPRWECILNKGFPAELETVARRDDAQHYLNNMRTFQPAPAGMGLDGVDIIIPAISYNAPIGFVFIGNIEVEDKGLSPVVKHLNFMQTISRIILAAIENKRLVEESLRQAALRKELELAARMQKMLIPNNDIMPDSPEITINGFYFPHYEVGGDYYDCIRLSPSKTSFCIADISGKGISAAILMSNFQASFRALITADIDLVSLMHKLNSIVLQNAAGEKFITFFVTRYDHETGVLEYINAAHNPPVLFNTVTGEIVHINASCVGLGMLDEIPRVEKSEIRIKDYTKLVCYTDGLSELKGSDGKDIGTREIINHIINKNPVELNIIEMIKDLGIPGNPSTFDDISILAADLRKCKA